MFIKKKTNFLKIFISITLLALYSCNNVIELESVQSSEISRMISQNNLSRSTDEICGTPLISSILAGQHINIGDVTVFNNDHELGIEVTILEDWYAVESHLHIALNPEDFPMTKKGNPQIGQFDYKNEYAPGVQEISYSFTLNELGLEEGDLVFIALHLSVEKIVDGEVVQEETAWNNGTGFPGRSWAMFMEYEVQECDDTPQEVGQLRTQTQGGWGSRANGNNPGSYRDANFDGAFPNGLVIGDESGNYAIFTTSAAVQDFLPQGGPANMLITTYIDPSSTSAGVLAGQVTALSLSVGFDIYDDTFGESEVNLKDLRIIDPSSPLFGTTVEDLLVIANEYLSTGSSEYSASEINDAVSSINENFVDGLIDNGFLGL